MAENCFPPASLPAGIKEIAQSPTPVKSPSYRSCQYVVIEPHHMVQYYEREWKSAYTLYCTCPDGVAQRQSVGLGIERSRVRNSPVFFP